MDRLSCQQVKRYAYLPPRPTRHSDEARTPHLGRDGPDLAPPNACQAADSESVIRIESGRSPQTAAKR